ncbi:MAG: hypothetical protein IPM56_12520 [Ignavibacteriales bacterium]|nr:MAG: hypothetical protein IPM56_12520 [Ignavibacteriales bacterium]
MSVKIPAISATVISNELLFSPGEREISSNFITPYKQNKGEKLCSN